MGMDFEKLFALPNEVVDEILGDWLTLQDLALRLDSAVTNHKYREKYLEHLSNSHVVSKSTLLLQDEDEEEEGEEAVNSDDELSLQYEEGNSESDTEGVDDGDDESEISANETKEDDDNIEEIARDGQADGEAEAVFTSLQWFKSRKIAIENIDIYRPLTTQDLNLTTAMMVEQVKNIVFDAGELQELDFMCLASCKNLKSLTLEVLDTDIETIRALLQNYSKLESLSIGQLLTNMNAFEVVKQTVGKTLEYLFIAFGEDIDFQISIHDLLEGFPKLKCFNVLNSSNLPRLIPSTSNMKFVQLITLEVTLEIAHAASFHCPNVENLFFTVGLQIEEIHEEYLDQMNHEMARNFTKLKYLQICNDMSHYDAKSFFNQSSFPSLLEIAIVGDYGISNQAWSCLIDSCPNVEIFTLKREHHALITYHHPGDEDFEMVISYYYGPQPNQILPELEDDYLVDKLCTKWTKLQDLKLCGLVRISDTGLLSVTKRADTLKSFHFTNPNLTVTSVAYQELRKCIHLQHLTLRKCGTLSDEDVAEILRNNRKLEKLSITHCPNLTSQVLTDFLNIPNRIKQLDTSYNKTIFDIIKLQEIIAKVFRSVSEQVEIHEKHYLRHLIMVGCCNNVAYQSELNNFIREISKETGLSPSMMCIQLSSGWTSIRGSE